MRFLKGGKGDGTLTHNTLDIELGPRELIVLAVDGLDIDIPAHRAFEEPGQTQTSGTAKMTVEGGMEIRCEKMYFVQ